MEQSITSCEHDNKADEGEFGSSNISSSVAPQKSFLEFEN